MKFDEEVEQKQETPAEGATHRTNPLMRVKNRLVLGPDFTMQ